jgi:hypothetical protein
MIRLINEALQEAQKEPGNAGDALNRAALIPFRYGLNSWIETFFQIEGIRPPIYELGVAYTRAHNFPSTQAHSIGLRVGGYYGWGTIDGGYAGPVGNMLTPISFRYSMLALELDADLRLSLSRRMQVLLRAGMRLGTESFSSTASDQRIIDGIIFGFPLTSGVSYRALPWLTFGVTAGAVMELRHLEPVLRYNGTGASVSDPRSTFEAVPVGGIHASLVW